jgi:pSer/pThr/pTyr-binding forkhead associated (FHA) protein
VATKRLFIDRDEHGHFFLSVEGGIVTIGDRPQDAELILRNLHVARIHCELDIEDEQVVVRGVKAPLGQKPLYQEMHPGEALHAGHSALRLEPIAQETGASAAPPKGSEKMKDDTSLGIADDLALAPIDGGANTAGGTATALAPQPIAGQLLKQLVVIDGGDQGRVFVLPESGVCTIGKSSKHADIVLHDLYVSRVHCELQIQGDSVRVVHVEGESGTLLDGQKISEQQMQLGSVLRVGNSKLRLEAAVRPGPSAGRDTKVDVLPPSPEAEQDVVEIEDVEIVEDIVEVVDSEAPRAEEDGPAYALPHSPIDQLLQWENQTLGHFQLGPLLGRGQSGLVFRAHDLQHNQVVALKVLSPDFPGGDEELKHFVETWKILPQLVHPNLTTLWRVGRSGAYCWIAREYVDGESLARVIHRIEPAAEPDWKLACRVLGHVGKALAFVHEHKVMHGNITPRNILLSKNKETKVADLLLGRALRGSRLHKIIMQKKLLAEAAYLAPEQTVPKGSVDSRTDLYALGAVAYTLLAGHPPFAGDSLQEIITQVREAKARRPSKERPGIPAPVEALVLKMMSRQPEDRFQNAAEMLADLRTIVHEHKH